MNKTNDKKYIILISIIAAALLVLFIGLAIFIVMKNKEFLDKQNVEVVIYQYEVKDYQIDFDSEAVEVYRAAFTKDLNYDEYIYTKDEKGYNHIVIADGLIKVETANCYNKTCTHTEISRDGLLSNRTIICHPHGLYIVLEEIEENK